MFERVPAWFRKLSLDWEQFGWVGHHKAMRQAEKAIEAEDATNKSPLPLKDEKDDTSKNK